MNFDFKLFSIGSLAALTLLAAPLAMTQFSYAQGASEGGRRGGHGGDRFEQLNLSDEQSAQIEAIRTAKRAEMEALLTPEQSATLENSDLQGRRAWRALELTDAQRTEARAIREASKEQIQGVLTAEQRQQLAQSRSERQERRGHGRNLEQLNLTEAQSAQIESIREGARGQMEAVLTAEQRASLENTDGEDGDRPGRRGFRRGFRRLDLSDEQREQLRSIREASKEQIQGVLSAEQRQQLEEMRGERGERRDR